MYSTSNLDDKINDLEGVDGTDELEQDSGMAKTYGEEIQKALNANGNYVNPYPTTNKTDLSADNWITGGKSWDDIEN